MDRGLGGHTLEADMNDVPLCSGNSGSAGHACCANRSFAHASDTAINPGSGRSFAVSPAVVAGTAADLSTCANTTVATESRQARSVNVCARLIMLGN